MIILIDLATATYTSKAGMKVFASGNLESDKSYMLNGYFAILGVIVNLVNIMAIHFYILFIF